MSTIDYKNFIEDFLDIPDLEKIEGRYSYEIEQEIYLSDIPEGFDYKIIIEANEIDAGIVEIFFNERKVSEVFSINTANTPTYVKRKFKNYATYDASLHLAINDPGQTIVLYGPSKLGKTSLWRNLLDERVILVSCNNDQNLEKIYYYIYQSINNPQTTLITNSKENFTDLTTSVGLDKGPITLGVSKNKGNKITSEEVRSFGELHIDVNLISKLAFKNNIPIVFENYHRLNDNTFKNLCIDLRSFSDAKVTTLFVGIPENPYLFTEYNPELAGRILFMEFLPWNELELKEIAKSGQETLNIIFDSKTLNFLSKEALGSPLLMQLFCLITCLSAGITARSRENIEIAIDSKKFKTAINKYGIQFLSHCKTILKVFYSTLDEFNLIPESFINELKEYIVSEDFDLFFDLKKIFSQPIELDDIKQLLSLLNNNSHTRDFLILDEEDKLQFGNPLAIVFARWIE